MRIERFAIPALALWFGLPAVAARQQPEPAAPTAPTAPAAPAALAQEAAVDPAVELFVAKCASCHTVGKGVRVGPDLSGATERRSRDWLRQMIHQPSGMLGRDADARKLLVEFNNVRMPDLGLADEQVLSLIDLIDRCSKEPCDLAGKFVPVTQAKPEDFHRGEEIFVGAERIQSGAAPCISCHDVAGLETFVPGGTLAVDLTHAFARLGDEGIDAALKNPSFPLMNKVFADHPLAPEEAFALRAFLYEANRRPEPSDENASLPLFGILATVLVLVILNSFWSRRLKGVRKPLTRGRGVAP